MIPKAKHTCPMCKVNVTKAKMKAMGIDENGMVDVAKPQTPQSKEYRIFVNPSSGERHSHSLSYEKQGQTTNEWEQFEDQANVNPETPTVHVQEPVYVNPCSYDAVSTVLRNIGHKCGIKKYGGNREWIIVVCDRVPHNLRRRIITSMHVCAACDVSLNGQEACARHNNELHPGENINFYQEFDWVLLQPGMGHVEMNMVKGVVKLCWDVFWKNMAICFNFRSEAALKGAKKRLATITKGGHCAELPDKQ